MLFLIDYNQRPHKVCWEDRKDAEGAKITFTAVPFIYLGWKLYDCQHGVDRKAASKQRMKDKTQARFVLVKLQNIMGWRVELKTGWLGQNWAQFLSEAKKMALPSQISWNGMLKNLVRGLPLALDSLSFFVCDLL